jgi:transposase InsO family protein
MHGGYSEVYGQSIQMKLRTSSIHIDINRDHANLPIVHDSFVSEKAKRGLAPLMRSGLCQARLSALDFFGEINASVSPIVDNADSNCFSCFPSIGDSENANLTNPQKELLLWHWKLGIGMQRIQELMRERTYEEPLGQRTVLPPIIKAKFPSARNCAIPFCQSCLLARARKRTPGVKHAHADPEKEGALSRDRIEVGDFVSTDQFICRTPGRLPEGYGRESKDRRFRGGTIYNDAASGLIWVENQVSLGANETVMGKARFEQWLWDMAYAEVKHYHGDNGTFSSEEYRAKCLGKGQSQSFSGVGVQHQNARAERAIQMIMYMARTFMVHASLHWTDRGSDDISLWPFAVKHAVWLYNRVPNRKSGLTPLELLTKSKADHRDLLRSHVWGCPAIVLEPQLQNDQKLPKWNRRARVGQFLGFSDEHLSLVANVPLS